MSIHSTSLEPKSQLTINLALKRKQKKRKEEKKVLDQRIRRKQKEKILNQRLRESKKKIEKIITSRVFGTQAPTMGSFTSDCHERSKIEKEMGKMEEVQ